MLTFAILILVLFVSAIVLIASGFGLPVLLLVCLYLLPTIIAQFRNHENKTAITALNILTGWSLVGWIISFIWSLTGKKQVRVYQN